MIQLTSFLCSALKLNIVCISTLSRLTSVHFIRRLAYSWTNTSEDSTWDKCMPSSYCVWWRSHMFHIMVMFGQVTVWLIWYAISVFNKIFIIVLPLNLCRRCYNKNIIHTSLVYSWGIISSKCDVRTSYLASVIGSLTSYFVVLCHKYFRSLQLDEI